jgi:hypothetical protein
MMQKYTGKITHIVIDTHTHSSFCVLNFVLPAGRSNFAEAAPTT